MRRRYVQGEILFYLFDGKKHTVYELSEKIEVSQTTIKRHIQDLSVKYPITTIKGGVGGGGGVLLEKCFGYTCLFSTEDLEIIKKALWLLPPDKTTCRLIEKIASI